MTSKDIQQKSVPPRWALVFSVLIHISLFVCLFVLGVIAPEKKDLSSIKVTMMEMPAPAPAVPQEKIPEKTVSEPEPEPEPVKAEPEPEPVKPAPAPEPEPPRPVKKEKKAPAVVPVKKIEQVIPVKKKPAVVKKPEKKPEKRKPTIAERLKKSRVVTARDVRKNQHSSRKSMSREQMLRKVNQGVRNSVSAVGTSSSSGSSSASERESRDYAVTEMNHIIQPLWEEIGPGRGELGSDNPIPVIITMIIRADGRVLAPAIARKSNLDSMNAAARRLLPQIQRRRFTPLKAKGIQKDHIRVMIQLTVER